MVAILLSPKRLSLAGFLALLSGVAWAQQGSDPFAPRAGPVITGRQGFALSASDEEFVSRCAQLAGQKRWSDMLALAQVSTGRVSGPVLGLVRGYALVEFDGSGEASMILRESMARAAHDGQLPGLLEVADRLGAQSATHAALLKLCREPESADPAFEAARLRWGKSGQAPWLAAAYEKAKVAAPAAASVLDYARYRTLLAGGRVDEAATLQAVEASPGRPLPRVTRAFALLRLGRAADAESALGAVAVRPSEMPPGAQAVIAAVLAANGHADRAAVISLKISRADLLPAEQALVAKLPAPRGTTRASP